MSGVCGAEGNENGVTWKLTQNNENGENQTYTLSISGTGGMRDFSSNAERPWNAYADKITEIEILDGVKTIGARAFIDLHQVKKDIILPDSVESFGDVAFTRCGVKGKSGFALERTSQ